MIEAMRAFTRAARAAGKTVGFVPTMGALHEGHATLIKRCAAECGTTVVSIFVNPAQFDREEDLVKYPRTLETDAVICQGHGADAVFAPDEKEMYRGGSMVLVDMAIFADKLCGITRPGHFRGVMLVVAKLFNIVQPDAAYFGEKDYQQLTIIRQLVRDLNFPVRIVPVPLVREVDGLALSSRNKRLTPKERETALKLSQALMGIKKRIDEAEGKHADLPTVSELLAEYAEELVSDPAIELDYFDAVDAETLTDVTEVRKGMVFALAAWVGQTRLIDNWIYR